MSETQKISIRLNGEALEVADTTTVEQLLEIAEIRSKLVAVEINQDIVPRQQHAERVVREGDEVEAVTLVGGG